MKRKPQFNLETIEVILTIILMVFVCVNVKTHWIPFYIVNALLILFLLLLVVIRGIEYHKYKRNKEGFSLLVIWVFIFFPVDSAVLVLRAKIIERSNKF